MGILIEYPKFQALNANGAPLRGGHLHTYIAGTATNKTTYSNRTLTTANANPVVLDSRGEATIYGAGPYKLILESSAGVTIWTMDNIELNPYGSYIFYPSSAEADHGVVSTGGSLKDILTAIGTTTKATVKLTHNGVAANTDYLVATTYDTSAYTNVHFDIENGARLAPAITKTLTLPSPSNIIASNQQIFSGAGTVSFASGGTLYPEWWGIDGTADDVQINQAIAAALSSGSAVSYLGKTYNTIAPIGYTGVLAKNIAFPSIIGIKATGAEPHTTNATIDGTVIMYTGTGNAVDFSPTGKQFMGGVIRDITIVKSGNVPYPGDGSKGLHLKNCLNYRLYNVTTLKFEIGFHNEYGWSWDAFGLTSMWNDIGVKLSNNSNACSINGLQAHQNGVVNLKIEGGTNISIDRATLEGVIPIGAVISSDGTTPTPTNISLSNIYLEGNPKAIVVGKDENGVISPSYVSNVSFKNISFSPPAPEISPVFEFDKVKWVDIQGVVWGQTLYPLYTTTDWTYNVRISDIFEDYITSAGSKTSLKTRSGISISNNLFPNGLLEFPDISDFALAGFAATIDTTTIVGETAVKIVIPNGTTNNKSTRKYIKIPASMVGRRVKLAIRAQRDAGMTAVFWIYNSAEAQVAGSGITIGAAISTGTSYVTLPNSEYVSGCFLVTNNSGGPLNLYVTAMVAIETSVGQIQIGPNDYLAGLSGTVNATAAGVDVTLTGWPADSYRVLLTNKTALTSYVTQAADKFTVFTVGGNGAVNWFVIPRAGILY